MRADPLPQSGVKGDRRCLFNDFLVTALNGAFAFEEVNACAVNVEQDLNFDMSRLLEKALDRPEHRSRNSTGLRDAPSKGGP